MAYKNQRRRPQQKGTNQTRQKATTTEAFGRTSRSGEVVAPPVAVAFRSEDVRSRCLVMHCLCWYPVVCFDPIVFAAAVVCSKACASCWFLVLLSCFCSRSWLFHKKVRVSFKHFRYESQSHQQMYQERSLLKNWCNTFFRFPFGVLHRSCVRSKPPTRAVGEAGGRWEEMRWQRHGEEGVQHPGATWELWGILFGPSWGGLVRGLFVVFCFKCFLEKKWKERFVLDKTMIVCDK